VPVLPGSVLSESLLPVLLVPDPEPLVAVPLAELLPAVLLPAVLLPAVLPPAVLPPALLEAVLNWNRSLTVWPLRLALAWK
jgi:hypothetical protein